MRDSEMKKNDISETFIKKAQALKKLGLSRRVFDKCESQGMFKSYAIDKNNFYKIADLDSFMATASYSKLVNGIVDSRNKLNDLTGKEWLRLKAIFSRRA